MSSTLLTPTGDRPEAFKLCQNWIGKQDYIGKIRWIIVDDGTISTEIKYKTHIDIVVIRLPSKAGNTQARNLTAGLKLVTEQDKLIIIEDDDYYAPIG